MYIYIYCLGSNLELIFDSYTLYTKNKLRVTELDPYICTYSGLFKLTCLISGTTNILLTQFKRIGVFCFDSLETQPPNFKQGDFRREFRFVKTTECVCI